MRSRQPRALELCRQAARAALLAVDQARCGWTSSSSAGLLGGGGGAATAASATRRRPDAPWCMEKLETVLLERGRAYWGSWPCFRSGSVTMPHMYAGGAGNVYGGWQLPVHVRVRGIW
jgi:hypothetical protein